jgi:glutathione peroxidase
MKIWIPIVLSAVSIIACTACSSADEKSTRTVAIPEPMTEQQTNPNAVPFETITGDTATLADLGGKATLIVNVASKCGNTPQYEGLEELYKEYQEQGLVVVGFPCNQFGGQEPGRNEEILTFCQTNYGVSFPIMSKIEVNGEGQHPLYRYLTKNSDRTGDIQWNFTKFLVDESGAVVARFEPAVQPQSAQVKDAIEKLL